MKYFLFDLDGTLTDPGLGITNSVMHALRRMGLAVPPREELYAYVGPPLTESFVNIGGVRREDAFTALGFFREYFSTRGILENEIYPGIPELLEEIRSGGGVIVLATGKPLPFAEKILEHFGIKRYFDYLAGNDMAEKYTKKRDLIEDVLREAGVSAANKKECVMIGDRSHDVIGAHEAGIEAVGVLYGYGSLEELEGCRAERIAKDVGELREICRELLGSQNGSDK